MADSKITALASIGTGTDPANDPLVIVDVSDILPGGMSLTGTTKKVTLNNLLACSPTATLASATITGDLTVDTSTLKVDSANNRVGIGTASPTAALDVFGAFGTSAAATVLRNNSAPNNSNIVETQYFASNNNSGLECIAKFGALNPAATGNNYGQFYWQIANAGSPTTAMTLNATGLGVGVASPNQKFVCAGPRAYFAGGGAVYGIGIGFNTTRTAADQVFFLGATDSATPDLVFSGASGAALMRLDASGNVGIGVTPKAWATLAPALQIGSAGAFFASQGSTEGVYIGSNAAYYGGAFNYVVNGSASYYRQQGGVHSWFYASPGTANNSLSGTTQAMTLDASGNLLCGSTALNATWNTRLTLSSDSGTTRWAVGPYSTATNFVISAASGGGVYLNGTAATSWTSASDERLKDIIEPISNAIAKVGSLRAVIGKFKSDDTNTRKSFLMAQDVQSVLPEAVDASNPDRLGLAYTDVIPLLVAAIKELTARVQTLETR